MKSRRTAPVDPTPGLGLEIEAPGASARAPLTVTGLTRSIRDFLETAFGEVWVSGEISNFRSPGSGHLYFTLKDETATLPAVMFRGEAARVGFPLRDGQAVLARGAITVYEARGQYQLQVAEIRARGQGTLQQQFEELKRRLQAENLFALERKRGLPIFPEIIGIVTSLQGAVLQDMLNILRRRAPGLRISVRGVRVQGAEAAAEIADAVAAFNAEAKVDLLIVARGGGSLEDLWAFNEEIVARALAVSQIPTVSAVGHETDFTIADFVADLRAPTPSAAAELIVRDWNEWRETVLKLRARLERTIRQTLAEQRRHLSYLNSSRALREPRLVIRQWAQRLDLLRESLLMVSEETFRHHRTELRLLETRLQSHHPRHELVRRRHHLEHLAARLRTLGPQATLDRGYALVLDSAGQPITRAVAALEQAEARIILGQGALAVTVGRVEPQVSLENVLLGSPLSKPPAKAKRGRAPKPPA